MNTRTTSRTLVFPRPFALSGLDGLQPAGVYVVEIDEEPIDEISFLAYRRTCTRLRLTPDPAHPGIVETVIVNPTELDAALPGSMA